MGNIQISKLMFDTNPKLHNTCATEHCIMLDPMSSLSTDVKGSCLFITQSNITPHLLKGSLAK